MSYSADKSPLTEFNADSMNLNLMALVLLDASAEIITTCLQTGTHACTFQFHLQKSVQQPYRTNFTVSSSASDKFTDPVSMYIQMQLSCRFQVFAL